MLVFLSSALGLRLISTLDGEKGNDNCCFGTSSHRIVHLEFYGNEHVLKSNYINCFYMSDKEVMLGGKARTSINRKIKIWHYN